MLSTTSPSSPAIKRELADMFNSNITGDSSATSQAASVNGMKIKNEASTDLSVKQEPSTQHIPTGPTPAQNSQLPTPAVPMVNAAAASVAPVLPTPIQTAVPMPQMMPQIPTNTIQQMPNILPPKTLAAPAPVIKAPGTSAVGATPGTVRSGNGGGGQLLQFPWKLHEMLHLAEKNGKTHIISWLPGGNGFKVHNKEKFCSEIMPGYFASQKYKTFQRSLNLWGFESVAKGPDRGACYHQYFVKGHPELCHSMTRVKIKGQSNPRTPAAAAAAAAAAAKRAAMTAAMSANQQQVQQSQQTQGLVAQQQQAQQQQVQQPMNLFSMNHFLPGANMAMPHLGMQVGGGNQAAAAFAMNNFAAMNALQQINPALAAAALQNPAMNAMLAAQFMAAAANNPAAVGAAQQAQARAMAAAQQQQQQLAPGAQRQGVAPVPGPATGTPGNAPGPIAGLAPGMATPGIAPNPIAGLAPGMAAPVGGFPQQQQQQQQQQLQQLQQQQQQLQLQQQQLQQQQQQLGMGMGMPPAAPIPTAPATPQTQAVTPGQMPVPAANEPVPGAPSAVNTNANANYAEFLARKANMERQQQQQQQQMQNQQQQLNPQPLSQQQQAMILAANNPLGNPSATSTAAKTTGAPGVTMNGSAPEGNNYGATESVEDLVAV